MIKITPKAILTILFFLFHITMVCSSTYAAVKEPGKDHPLVGRYEGSIIKDYKTAKFDQVSLISEPYNTLQDELDNTGKITLEGKTTFIYYQNPKDRSTLEIVKNFEEKLKSESFEIVFFCHKSDCLKNKNTTDYYNFGDASQNMTSHNHFINSISYLLAKLSHAEKETYVSIIAGNGLSEHVTVASIVEVQAMERKKIVFIDAQAMEQGISSQGRIALYGILFDTDKAEIRVESEPTLKEIAKFLQANKDTRLIVTGHTDDQGGFNYNVNLSKRRAESVITYLTQKLSIDKKRLLPFGAGMTSPIASNHTEEGRSKNRRVELVKQ